MRPSAAARLARAPAPVRLVLLDAFGTLLRPRIAPHLQYGEEARKLGISYDAEALAPAFKQAFRHLAAAHPSYAPIGPDAWWTRLIVQTFAECAPAASPAQVEEELAPRLLQRFSSAEAYELFPETIAALQTLRALRPVPEVVLASNGDARIVDALRELLSVQHSHLLELQPGRRLSPCLTWDLRASKPERAFFRRVLARVGEAPAEQADGEGPRWDELARHTLVVGDMRAEDYDGAMAAGTQVLLLDRDGTEPGLDVRIDSLRDVPSYVQQSH